jgi:hypothetical protein
MDFVVLPTPRGRDLVILDPFGFAFVSETGSGDHLSVGVDGLVLSVWP